MLLTLASVDVKVLPVVLGVAVTVVGLLAAGWGAFRSQAASSWRLAAEGYKEQVTELNGRLALAETLATSLQGRVDQLERRPDLQAVLEAVDGRTKAIMDAVKSEAGQIVDAVHTEGDQTRAAVGDVKGVLDGVAQRRG